MGKIPHLTILFLFRAIDVILSQINHIKTSILSWERTSESSGNAFVYEEGDLM